ncbi:GNAT family N-acetyltransferase [Corallococcus exiguus]|uniref:GNAT family N-acetyltransferase n=1 Tax=Corallococcus TaxID=83461 RepID=UPI000EA109ED|nr:MULTISPECIES: GNAT family N-acetyltransferase [Corallococcus]NNC15615.1 GNAT family N-acetyltransferase [Corallococcus exiguus]NPC74091.1 GNAT family N-acetyltransferase [Corallococcus exiguus]NRD53357.1 GNAT family N-acetyltransferase [Corallococcus exiguus]NRD63204.1 GNAT family N-acetyltransferase [Corallococcus exiguus]RKH20894.1 N-acetyltransferase [Corallococcus sp. CA041A]
MTDAELTLRLHTNLIAFKRLQAERGPLRHLHLPGVDAFALPGYQDAHFQQVLFTDADALAAALPAITDFYRGHGLPRWRVTLTPGQRDATRVLGAAGYRPDFTVVAMGAWLKELPDAAPGVPVEPVEDMDDLVEINVQTYGTEWRDILSVWQRPPRLPVHTVVAREHGRALSCGLAVDVADTAGVYLVATHPEARGLGLASAVMRGIISEARKRGCTATVLQSTPAGIRVYRHLGYRDLGPWEHWVPQGR